jgi:hypothetical protein
VSLPLPLGLTEETKVSSFFWKICPGRSIHSRPGDPYVHYPGFPSFFQFLHLKEALPFFSNFYSSWKPPFFSNFYSSWKLRFRAPSRNFQKCWQLERLPLLTKEKLPKISKKVSSWKLPFFSKFYSSWETHLLECDPEKGKKFFQKKT